MTTFAVFTRAEAPKFARLIYFLFDLPIKGVNVGGGRHIDIPDTPGIGWVRYYVSWISKPSNDGYSSTDEFAIRITQEMQDRWADRKSQLTAAQITWVQNHLASAASLAADWLSTDPDTGQTYLAEDTDVAAGVMP